MKILIPLLVAAVIIAYFVAPIIRIRALKPDTDVIRWINATHAVLTAVNNKNFQVFGGTLPTDRKRRKQEIVILEKWWEIVDQASLNQTVDWLINEGHRANDGNTAETPKNIAAWDYSRALSLLSSGYLAGYLDREEALNRSLALAKRCQQEYGSWDEFMEAYFRGYERWSGDHSGHRRKVYGNLKALPASPYRLDWHLDLKKDWD